MRSALVYTAASLLVITAIVAVTVAWTHFSHLHRYQGPVLAHLWGTHGLHLGDLVALAVELLLLLILVTLLLAGFTRPR